MLRPTGRNGQNGVPHLYHQHCGRGAENLSTFDDDKVAHLERLSPEERAEIAFVMIPGDFFAAKKKHQERAGPSNRHHSHPKDPPDCLHTDIKIATDYEEIWQRSIAVPAYLARIPSFLMHSLPQTSALIGSPAAKYVPPTSISVSGSRP